MNFICWYHQLAISPHQVSRPLEPAPEVVCEIFDPLALCSDHAAAVVFRPLWGPQGAGGHQGENYDLLKPFLGPLMKQRHYFGLLLNNPTLFDILFHLLHLRTNLAEMHLYGAGLKSGYKVLRMLWANWGRNSQILGPTFQLTCLHHADYLWLTHTNLQFSRFNISK